MKIMAKEVYFLPAATLGAVRSTGAKVRSAYMILVEEARYNSDLSRQSVTFGPSGINVV